MKEECDSCGFVTEVHVLAPSNILRKESMTLCRLCADTFAANALEHNYEDQPLYSTICYIGNVILEEIRKR